MKSRYARQIAIPEIGTEGQKKLLNAKVLIIGCGALGSMVAMQLGGAGIGNLAIADYDTIDISNLQRQFFFSTSEAGQKKTEVLGNRLKAINPEVNVMEFNEMITTGKAENLFRDYDFIIDCTDNPESKKMIGEISKELGKPCCIGGVKDFSGQIITFLPSDMRFEEYFGLSTTEGYLPCSISGVIGPAAAVCASIQASETIKYFTNTDRLLTGQLLIFNLLTNTFKKFYL